MILENYCYTIPMLFDDAEVEQIHQHAQQYPVMEGQIGQGNQSDPDAEELDKGGETNNRIRQSDVRWCEDQLPKPLLDKLYAAVEHAQKDSGWNFEFEYQEKNQYTIYHHRPDAEVTGDFYTWHTDAGPRPYEHNGQMRKLSYTIQLSDPEDYEGGNFQWMEDIRSKDTLTEGDYTRDMKDFVIQAPFSAKQKGSLIIFPSFLHHQVTPLLRGTRISLVGWLCGYPYK